MSLNISDKRHIHRKREKKQCHRTNMMAQYSARAEVILDLSRINRSDIEPYRNIQKEAFSVAWKGIGKLR